MKIICLNPLRYGFDINDMLYFVEKGFKEKLFYC